MLISPEFEWQHAIAQWRCGDPSGVAELLRGNLPMPGFAREWLARVVDGSETRPRGRPAHPPERYLDLVMRVLKTGPVLQHFAEHRQRLTDDPQTGGTPTEQALAATAEAFGLTVDQVSKIVFPRRPKSGGAEADDSKADK